MLPRVYYLYEKAPKKCRELNQIEDELKHCLEPSDLPVEGGNKSLRACGTRFTAHKVVALGRVIDRLGAHLSHLSTLSEDRSLRAADRRK